MRRVLKATLVGAVLGLTSVGAGPALAADVGVHVDPGSPAGKEYALPLDSARRDAAGPTGDGSSPPLFGAGISNRNGGDSDGPDATGAGTRQGGQGGTGDGGGSSGDQRGSQPGLTARTAANAGDGPSAGLLTALVALGVLGVGGLIGLTLRVVRRAHPTG